ncbi:MAG: XTP/dITP diphosphatase [Candidatus Bathyarchaeia archaeon]
MATGNRDKYLEARATLSKLGVELRLLEVDRMEIQADDLEAIASFSVGRVATGGRPVVVEDAGLFIDRYGGFPGPYSSYALRTIGLEGVLKLMEGVESRGAAFRSAVAYRHGDEVRCFIGTVRGRIARSIRGAGGFGYDPIFIPEEGDGRTFGEMEAEEKNALSHRARAFRSFGEWLTSA